MARRPMVGYVMPPQDTQDAPGLHRTARLPPQVPYGAGLRTRWQGRNGGVLEWNCEHARFETYDRAGKHQAAVAPPPAPPGREQRQGPSLLIPMHGITAYGGEGFVTEMPIPRFYDALALKLADVPVNDNDGAASYALSAHALDTLRFLLGLDTDPQPAAYFLEPSWSGTPGFSTARRRAVGLLTEIVPPRPGMVRAMRVLERDLVVPILTLLAESDELWMTVRVLCQRLAPLFGFVGIRPQELEEKRDLFDLRRKVRTIIVRRALPDSFMRRGLVLYDDQRDALRLTSYGRFTIDALRS